MTSAAVPRKSPASKHVLVVEDDDLFRETLVSTLKHEGYRVTAVPHAKLAQDIVTIEAIDIVVSDINMPQISGIQLLHFVKRTRPDIPVILMTGFAEIKETKEAYELGASGFLPKPFQKEELLGLMGECLFPKADASGGSEESQDLDFCKLSIDDFISGKEIKFDIYVRLSKRKYVKIAYQGEDIPQERIGGYKAKNIRYLYMRKDDFCRYMDFNLALLPLVASKSAISKEKKHAFLKHTGEVLLEHLHLHGVDEAGFQNAKLVVESTVSLLTEPDDMMKLLETLNSHTDYLYAHSLGVSMYSVLIARAVGWRSPANIYKVAMGGFLHDIGKREIDRGILEKKRLEMTPEEVRLYESHPYRGAEILRQVSSVPTDVLQIVLQHHENCMGMGFPSGLSRNHIHPMARVVAVANEFCALTIKNQSAVTLPPQEAIKRMIAMHLEKLDSVFFATLMGVFRMTPPEDLFNKRWKGET